MYHIFFFIHSSVSGHLGCFHVLAIVNYSAIGEESACNAEDLGLIFGSGRFPGGGHGNSLQYSCLENPMDRAATVHRVAKSWTRLSDFTIYHCLCCDQLFKRFVVVSAISTTLWTNKKWLHFAQVASVQFGSWHPTPVFLAREFHGQRSLKGCSPESQRVGHN